MYGIIEDWTKQFVYIHAYICTYEHTYIHTYIYTYIHIHTYIHTYNHTYMHTYIHTYIHTYWPQVLHTLKVNSLVEREIEQMQSQVGDQVRLQDKV